MEYKLSVVVCIVLWNTLGWPRFTSSETIEQMKGPQKYKDTSYKRTTNKTIPYCEKPGEEMIAFDVDGTLWPFDIDTDPRFQDPFVIKSFDNGTVLVNNHTIEPYPEVEETLLELIEKGYVLAAVALTNSTHKTMALLNAFDFTQHFKHMEMAPGPDKLTLITSICSRSGILLKNVVYFEKDPGEVLDLIWNHVIVYSVGDKGVTKDTARKGLFVFDLRPKKERTPHGLHEKKVTRIEHSNKNKCRPAYEKDGTEIEGFDYNATKIEYLD